MMMHAWSRYEMYAWGSNELRPEAEKVHDHHGPFPGTKMGLTIVDSLDTLWMMGLFDEVQKGKEWAVEHLRKAMNVVSI